jgi:hypothetical protein
MKEIPPSGAERAGDLSREEELRIIDNLLAHAERMNRAATDWLSGRTGEDADAAYRLQIETNQSWVAYSLKLLGIPPERLREGLARRRESDS